MSRRRAGLAALALLAAGCGTTVSGATNTAGDAGLAGNNGLSVPGSTTPNGAAPAAAAGGVAAAGAGVPVAGSIAGGTAAGTNAVPGPAVARGATFAGPGLTDRSITVGVIYPTNVAARGAALGVTNVNTGDPLAEQKAIIKDINASGGIGGRKLLYVAHAVDATSTETYAQQDQEICADFTQDHKVFAMIGDYVGDTLHECLNKAGAGQVVESAGLITSTSTYRRFPYFVAPSTLRQDRVAAQWVPALVNENYFQKWDPTTGQPGVAPVRVGIIALDTPENRYAVEKVLKPELKTAGYPAFDTAYLTEPQGTSDSGSTLSDVQSAVLKFRSDNVTHLLPFDSAAGLSLYFGRNASSQHYYPRYGLNSGDGVQVLLDAGLMPKDQLNGAVGYGWEPLLDVADDGTAANTNMTRQRCVALMRKAGIDISGAAATRGAIENCDQFWFFKAAVERGGAFVSRPAFLAGVNAEARAFVSGATFATLLAPAQHDGVAAIRDFAYANGCGCFRYTSAVRRIS